MSDIALEGRKPGFKFALFAIIFASLVIMLGAFTRLVDAGLGCPDWPGCYGHILWPDTEAEVAAANAKFPDMPVEHDKTWPEQVHRIFAGSLGLLCIAMVVIAVRQRRQGNTSFPMKLPLLILAMVIVQGIFGMWTVTLKLWPKVVTLHLLGGFTTIALFTLLAFRLAGRYWRAEHDSTAAIKRLKPLLAVAFFAVVVQIALGGWTTSNYAALACPDFPTCQTRWIPDMDFAEGFNIWQTIGPNYLGGIMDSDARTAIHFSHRVGAIIVTVVVLLLVFKLHRTRFAPAQAWSKILLGVLLLQLGLGVSNIIFALPLGVAVAHNAVGAALLLVMVGLSHRMATVRVNQ